VNLCYLYHTGSTEFRLITHYTVAQNTFTDKKTEQFPNISTKYKTSISLISST